MIPHHSRIRGEHRDGMRIYAAGGGSSPHSRGTLSCILSSPVLAGIIPAFAGNTFCMLRSRQRIEDHPRIRGEHSTGPWQGSLCVGSSPHSRGTQHHILHLSYPLRIIPAFAGNTNSVHRSRRRFRDHPRIRGEHASFSFFALIIPGSSPHSRGTRVHVAICSPSDRIIPAFAGNTCGGNGRYADH